MRPRSRRDAPWGTLPPVAPCSLALLFALLAPPTVDVAAARLEAGPDGWRAEGLQLELRGTRLDAATAEGTSAEACPAGRLTLTDVRLAGPRVRGAADAAQVCLGPEAAVLEADGLWVSPCGCADPPWRVSAAASTVTAGEGAWLDWPVLRAGDVPVLAAPIAYVPLARRRTGFLLPRVGWDAADGLYGALPFFWAPAGAFDLTLTPGWRGAAGLSLDGRLRWAATPEEGGELELRTLPLLGDGLATGRGSLPLGPLRLAVDGEAAASEDGWRRLRRGVFDRRRQLLRADLSAAVAADDLGLGLRQRRLQRIGTPNPGPFHPTTAWLRVGSALGPARLALSGAAIRVPQGAAHHDVFDMALHVEAHEWLGPLEVRPVLAGRTRIHPAMDDAPAEQSLAGMLGLEATLAARRRFAAGLHRIALTADGRVAEAETDGERVLDHADRPRAAQDLGLTLSTSLAGLEWSGRLSARLGWDGLTDGPAPLWLRGRLDGPWVALTADGAADGERAARALWLDGRFGPADGPRIDLAGAWVRAGPRLPWLTPVGLTLPTLQIPGIYVYEPAPLAPAPLIGGIAGLTLPLGPLTVGWRAALDLTAGADTRLVGQIGTLDWRGRCECWSAGLWLGHEAGRSAPDVMLELTLGRL